jgi:two-component system sensor histidine kinase ChiS
MRKKIKNRKYVLFLAISLVLAVSVAASLFAFASKRTGQIHSVGGALNLKNWEPARDGYLNLSGEWDFYWNRFLSYSEAKAGSTAPDLKANVPDVWNNYQLNGKNLPGFGYGTYVLHVTNVPNGTSLALRMPPFSTAYALYVNDHLYSAGGKVGTDKDSFTAGYKPQVVEFTPAGQSFTLIVHVANFTYAQGGMCYMIKMGTPEQIRNLDKTIADTDLFLFGALAIMSFYHMGSFLLRRDDKSNLYFVLICILLAGRTSISGDYLIIRLLPFISFESIIALDYLTLCWFSVFAIYVIKDLFPGSKPDQIIRVSFIYAAVMTLIILLTPISFYSRLIYLIDTAAVMLGIYCMTLVAKAFLHGKKEALIVLLISLMVFICAAFDMIFQTSMSKYGYLIIVFTQPLIIAERFSLAYKNANELSQKLIKLSKVKDEFLANTSHELRTPLNGILSLTEAILKGSGKLSESQRKRLTLIAGSSRRLAHLVNDILDYAKLKNRELTLNIRPIQITGLIETVIKVFQQIKTSQDYEILFEIPKELPPVSADENRVVQILYNLIGNAVKFTEKGFVKITVRTDGNMLEVCIADTGEGIAQDKLEDIFKSFEQADTSLTRRYGGTGLGLSITKHLVELQGGSIWVESILGQGSRFYFTLPLADSSSEASAPSIGDNLHTDAVSMQNPPVLIAESPDDENTKPDSQSILLVDDDAVNLQAAAAVLKLGGYKVTFAGSGKAALEELAKPADYALIILDVMMPELSGYDVCRKLRENKTHLELPVLMLTAKGSTEDILLGFEAGANDYLLKPFEPEELLARVKTLTGMKASAEKAKAAEMAFMQAQIKPHFLFNALNAISSFCDTEPERAQQTIDAFSQYLRYSFDFKSLESHGTLERELIYVSSYLEIEKARFGNKLQVVFDIDNEVSVMLPVLCIQPLVENAVNHGLRKKSGHGIVTVSVKKIPGAVRIEVADDGQGISAEKLATLLEKDSGRGIGLWNIDNRLKKLYGQGLNIESVVGRGTIVSFHIPYGGDLP